MNRFSQHVEETLRAAGWFPERVIDVNSWRQSLAGFGFPVHAGWSPFMEEFGGLVFNLSGSGISRAREPFALDPILIAGEDDRFTDWSEIVGFPLSPIGELDNRYALGLGADGRIYALSDWLADFGLGDRGLENLILGVAPDDIPFSGEK